MLFQLVVLERKIVSPLETPWNRARGITKSQRQEKKLGKMPEAHEQVNSGRFWRWKRDGIVWNFLVEARTTDKESYAIKGKEFRSIRREAITTPPGLKPAMQIDIGDVSLWVMELSDWEAVYTRLIDVEARLGEQEADT